MVCHYTIFIDNGAIVLAYQGTDSSVCSTNKLKPSVQVKLTCANSLGSPKYIREESNCTFIFEVSGFTFMWDFGFSCALITIE